MHWIERRGISGLFKLALLKLATLPSEQVLRGGCGEKTQREIGDVTHVIKTAMRG